MKRLVATCLSALMVLGFAPDADAGHKKKKKKRCRSSHSRHHHGYSSVHRCGHCGALYRGHHSCGHRDHSRYGRIHLSEGGIYFNFGRSSACDRGYRHPGSGYPGYYHGW